MSLKQVSLDPFLLAQLYKCPVVPSEKTVSPDNPSQLNFLGNHSKQITLLIYNKEQTWLSEEHFTFLTKILQACGLSMDDIALINVAFLPEVKLPDLLGRLETKKLILLGSSLEAWSGQTLKKNATQTIEKIPALYSDSLGEMQSDAQLKKDFWKALRDFFELKK